MCMRFGFTSSRLPGSIRSRSHLHINRSRPPPLRVLLQRPLAQRASLLPRRRSFHAVVPRSKLPRATFQQPVNSSTTSTLAAILGALVIGSAIYLYNSTQEVPLPVRTYIHPPLDPKSVDDVLDYYFAMTTNAIPEGRPGNLTAQQEANLRELWRVTLQLFGVYEAAPASPTEAVNGTTTAAAVPTSPTKPTEKKEKRSRLSFFRRGKSDNSDSESTTSTTDSINSTTATSNFHDFTIEEDDKHGMGKEFKRALATSTPEQLRARFWSMVKHDNPDAVLMRFVRARKGDVQAAMVMMMATMHWRATEMHVDDQILNKGEEGFVREAEGNADVDAYTKKEAEYFMTQLRTGKSYVHGTDRDGRPISVVRVRMHHASDQTESSLERFTVYIMETARLMLRPPVDTATLIFDMTDFSLANMDYAPVRFIIKCFEANYPESLGAILVHRAPWIFQGIWAIIKNWIDPVVAGKIHFTRNYEELSGFIAPSQIPTELGGEEKWTYTYMPPVAGENAAMEDTETRDRLLAEREEMVKTFESQTLKWIRDTVAPGDSDATAQEKGKSAMEERMRTADELRKNYWDIDPHVRARSLWDRIGVINGGGKVNFYPPPPGDKVEVKVNGAAEKVQELKLDDKPVAEVAPPVVDEITPEPDKKVGAAVEEKKIEQPLAPAPVAVTTAVDDVD